MGKTSPIAMRFLVDADLPRAVTEVIREKGYEALDVRDTPLSGSPDDQIAAFVKKEGYCLVTGDFDFADIRSYPPGEYCGLIVLALGRNATAERLRELAESLLGCPDILARVPGRLAIVEPGRVRLRPA